MRGSQEEEEEEDGEEEEEESEAEEEEEESDAEDEQEEDEEDNEEEDSTRPSVFSCDPCKVQQGREGIYEPIQDFTLIEIGKEAFATCQICKLNFHLYCEGERRAPKNMDELIFHCKKCRTGRRGFTRK